MTSSFCFDILLNFRTTYIDEVCGVSCCCFFCACVLVRGQVEGKNMETKKNQRHNWGIVGSYGSWNLKHHETSIYTWLFQLDDLEFLHEKWLFHHSHPF